MRLGVGTGLNRRELYTDARDVSSTVDNETLTDAEYNAQLSQRGLENLAENIATKSFEGKVKQRGCIDMERTSSWEIWYRL